MFPFTSQTQKKSTIKSSIWFEESTVKNFPKLTPNQSEWIGPTCYWNILKKRLFGLKKAMFKTIWRKMSSDSFQTQHRVEFHVCGSMWVNIKDFFSVKFNFLLFFHQIFQMWPTLVVWSIVWSLEIVAFSWQPLQPKSDGQCWSSISLKII